MNREEKIEINNKKIWIDNNDWRGRRIKELKGTQSDKIQCLKKVVENEDIDLFLDIGANYGEFSLQLCDLGIDIICFEPNPICDNLLNKTFKDYDNVKIIKAGVGKTTSISNFFYSENYSGGGSLSENVIKKCPDALNEVKSIQTQIYSLDDYLINNNISKKQYKNILMKIDVEGYEDEVIKGSKHLLSKCENWKALIEINKVAVTNAGKNWDEWINIFNNFKKYEDFKSDILIGK